MALLLLLLLLLPEVGRENVADVLQQIFGQHVFSNIPYMLDIIALHCIYFCARKNMQQVFSNIITLTNYINIYAGVNT